MPSTPDKLLAIARLEESVLACLRGAEARTHLAKILFANLREGVSHGTDIGAHLSAASAADLLRLTTKSSTFKRAVKALVGALRACRPDKPELISSSDDRPGVACISAFFDGNPFLVIVRGPTAAHRGPSLGGDDDGLLRLQAEFRPLAGVAASNPDTPHTPATRYYGAAPDSVPVSHRYPPPRQLPPAPPDLTGRDSDLQELIEIFAAQKTKVILLSGLSGIGKSSLALRFAASIESRFAGQIFVDMRGTTTQPLSPQDVMTHVIHAYLPNESVQKPVGELSGLYYSLLKQQPALLLLDNAAAPDQLHSIVPPSDSFLIITSQRRFTLPGAHSKTVEPLDPSDARRFLISIAHRCGDQDAAAIAELCGHHPLALRASACFLAQTPDLTPSNYAARLTESKASLLKLNDPSTSRSVDAVLSVTFHLLSDTLRELLLALSPLHSFDRAAATAMWELTPDLTATALSQLLTYNLIEYDSTTDRYRLHDLVKLFLRSRLTPERKAALLLRQATHFLSVTRSLNTMVVADDDAVTQALLAFDRDIVNILMGWHAALQLAEREELARLALEYPAAASNLLNHRLSPSSITSLLEGAVRIGRKIGDQPSTGLITLRLAVAYTDTVDRRALSACEEGLALALSSNDSALRAHALQLAAQVYWFYGSYTKAIDSCLKALTLLSEAPAELRRVLMDTQRILGNSYVGIFQCRLAVKPYRSALQIARDLRDSHSERVILDALGTSYAELGRKRAALSVLEAELTHARTFGHFWDAVRATASLAGAYLKLGNPVNAMRLYNHELDLIRERQLSWVPTDEVNALIGWAAAARDLGGYNSAFEGLQLASARALKCPDPDFYEAKVLEAIADVYLAMNKPESALPLFQKEIDQARPKSFLAPALWHKSRALHQAGRESEAIAAAHEALSILRERASLRPDRIDPMIAEIENTTEAWHMDVRAPDIPLPQQSKMKAAGRQRRASRARSR